MSPAEQPLVAAQQGLLPLLAAFIHATGPLHVELTVGDALAELQQDACEPERWLDIQSLLDHEMTSKCCNAGIDINIQHHSCAIAAGSPSSAMPVRSFLSTISPVIAREPAIFVEALANTCNVEEASGSLGSGRPIVVLKPKVFFPDYHTCSA